MMQYVKSSYPDLNNMELLFIDNLERSEEWLNKIRELQKENKWIKPEFEVIVFPQVWGSTNTAFDVMPDGSPAIGSSAMTKAYTVVLRECATDTYGIYVNDEPCYMIYDATEEFYKDLAAHNIKSISEARKAY